jgi:RecA-family ATPase
MRHHDGWEPLTMDNLDATAPMPRAEWLWNGYLMPGDITLLTSFWKTGKTTLLAGLLQSLATGTPFLGRNTRPARVWVVSEESRDHWRERGEVLPGGSHVTLVGRPFHGKPKPEQWDRLIDAVLQDRPDLFVVDPLSSFLTARSESDVTTMLEALEPLRRLTGIRMAVLLLHHPRKKAAAVGNTARGSGVLLSFVDATMELTRYSTLPTDANRRLIRAQSRRWETSDRLAYEWNRTTGVFTETLDPRHRQFEENWQMIVDILKDRQGGIASQEIAACWPSDVVKPSLSTIYSWMALAHERKLIVREGSGNSKNPWRYRANPPGDTVERERGTSVSFRDSLAALECVEPLK